MRGSAVAAPAAGESGVLARVLSSPRRRLAFAVRVARATLRFVAANPLPAATVFAVLVYGLVRLYEATFYAQFGIAPEEVGLGYKETLERSGAAFFLIASMAILASVGVVLMCVGWWMWVRIAQVVRLIRRPVRAFPRLGDVAAFCAVYGVLAAMVAYGVITTVQARDQARDVIDFGVVLWKPGFLEEIYVEPAQVRWVNGRTPRLLAESWAANRPLMYLGRTDSVYVLYSQTLQQTIEVPTDSATIAIERPGRTSRPD